MRINDPEIITDILKNSKTLAVVGLSSKPTRPSHGVADYLQSVGYRIVPVNPNETQVLGERSYPRLGEVPMPFDGVVIFRRSEEVGPIVDQAIACRAQFVWMQEGVCNDAAARRALEFGLHVVMNRCMLKEHRKLHYRSAHHPDESPLSRATT